MVILENFVQVVEQHKNSIVIGNDGNDSVRDAPTEFKWSSQSPLSKMVVSDPYAQTCDRDSVSRLIRVLFKFLIFVYSRRDNVYSY
mmetsp:Transcript_22483/g.48893  ORF Transcript_22483/g.48893 Transcript_22483/m.48893 type:complete len:86 (+) Transcript_22483:467-724(+)